MGAVFFIARIGRGVAGKAEEVVNNFYFANGITFDKTEKYMYMSESIMDRVLRFRVDVENGSVPEREVYRIVYVPDNLAIDRDNNLWIASFVGKHIMVVDYIWHTVHKVFQATSVS